MGELVEYRVRGTNDEQRKNAPYDFVFAPPCRWLPKSAVRWRTRMTRLRASIVAAVTEHCAIRIH